MNIPTPHINAKAGDFAKTVLMPGDPKRAEHIAKNFLTDVRLVTDVRGMLGFTGTYKGQKISVMGSGMGVPSIGIYAYELYNFYDVENIIRIGTCGAASDKLKVLDIIASVGASYDTAFATQYNLPGTFSAAATFSLLKTIDETAQSLNIPVIFGNTVTCDSFYAERAAIPAWATMGILAAEMETAGLYMTASAAGKNAASLLSVADNMFSGETTDIDTREKSLNDMAILALEAGIKL
ncbi:MAG: purine-nucleoside phosphorylase [Oscillospiraceae bacterium]|nr:purine-nucleoside phosphorylase [Oscillospiraceae bacterium]